MKNLLECKNFRYSAVKCKENNAESCLHFGHFVKIIEHNLCVCISLYGDFDVHTVSVGVVLQIGNAFNSLVLDEVGNFFNKSSFVYAVRKFGYDNLKSVVFGFLDFGSCTNNDFASAGSISFSYALCTHNYAVGRKVRTFDVLHNFFKFGIRIVNKAANALCNLAHVMRRNVGCHTYCDTR